MAPYDEEFTRLKAGHETRKIAKSLYLKASELTKPGSGRSLGQGQSALAAVCAFLASKRLGNGEITREQACAVACVDPKTFEATLATVESVTSASRSSPRHNQRNITYRSLLKQFVEREDAYVPMVEVEATLRSCEGLVDGSPIDPESSLIQCAIFYWVCTFVLKVAVPDTQFLRQMVKVSPRTWSAAQRVLENHCSHMTDDLIRKAETALSARTVRSEMQTGTKGRVQASLTKLIGHVGKSSVPLTPPTSSPPHQMKRKLPAQIQSNENESPSKRAKGSVYIPSALGQDLSTHTPKARRCNAAVCLPTPSKSPLVIHEEESENEESTEVIVVRSTPRKKVNCSAWDLQKPVTTTVGVEPLTPSSSIQGSPPVGHIAFDDTPKTSPNTSTGMSDAFSPVSLTHSPAVQARLHAPLTAKGLSYTIQEEEMPRRRRRNLRAAYLTPEVYGWKPAARTAKQLERAKQWESRMINQHGDPWDVW